MFFRDERQHFFKPLTGKYRQQVLEALQWLYRRQFSAEADYGQALRREQIGELLAESLANCANRVLDSSDDSSEPRFKHPREQANWVLKQLIECGWIERQVDPATLESRFPFTRTGRLLAQALCESDQPAHRTRHRHTRNTLNALEAFLNRGEIYDLLDALETSERIITDFTDVIAELDERKRELVREVERAQVIQEATAQFFDFMETRFAPDIAVRLSADSVEKHRDDIEKTVGKIRRKPKAFKQNAERELRRIAPTLAPQHQSFLWHVLDTIEQRMRNAADIMLPSLRHALHSFTKRADIIIRQLSYLNAHHDNDLIDVCHELADLPEVEYDNRMQAAAELMAGCRLQLIDPQHVRLIERKRAENVDSIVPMLGELDAQANADLQRQLAQDQAFSITREDIKSYVERAMAGRKDIESESLPVENARDLLARAHMIELAAQRGSGTLFHIEPEEPVSDPDTEYYFYSDRFRIRVNETQDSHD